MRYEIMPMQRAQLDAVAALETICFSAPWTREGLAEELDNPLSHFLTAVCGTTVLGYIGVQEICGEGYITNVAVLPEYRRAGVGEALLRAAIRGAAERGCAFLSLEVRVGNAPAIRLYERVGFRPQGRRKAFYRDPTEDASIYTIFLREESE